MVGGSLDGWVLGGILRLGKVRYGEGGLDLDLDRLEDLGDWGMDGWMGATYS